MPTHHPHQKPAPVPAHAQVLIHYAQNACITYLYRELNQMFCACMCFWKDFITIASMLDMWCIITSSWKGKGSERMANEHCQLNWASVNNFIAIITHIHNANDRNFWEMKYPFAYVLLSLLLLFLSLLSLCAFSYPQCSTLPSFVHHISHSVSVA